MKLSKINIVIAAILTGIFLFFGCTKKQAVKQWYKGNLHTHSYWSDGDAFPETVVDWYKSHGYNFVAMTDHNILAQGEKWKRIPEDPIHQQAFESYLSKYGEKQIEYKKNADTIKVKLKTFEEYIPLFDEPGKFLVIPSEEISDKFNGSPIHLNAIHIQNVIPPQKGQSVVDVLQNDINAVLGQIKESNIPSMVQINHPNFHFAFSTEDMAALENARFFEVHNGHPSVYNYGDSIHPGTELMWDRINIAFIKQGKTLLYGVASDDSHNYHVFDSKKANPGRGWVMVNATELTPESLIKAMGNGDFYASTGVVLKEVCFKNNRLKISVKTEPAVNYKIQFIGCTAQDNETSVLQESEGGEATFNINKDVLFVRAKIISDKLKENPFQEGDYEVAWSQPVKLQ